MGGGGIWMCFFFNHTILPCGKCLEDESNEDDEVLSTYIQDKVSLLKVRMNIESGEGFFLRQGV